MRDESDSSSNMVFVSRSTLREDALFFSSISMEWIG